MTKATGTMKGSIASLWSNPIHIDIRVICKGFHKIKMARGAGIPKLVFLGGEDISRETEIEIELLGKKRRRRRTKRIKEEKKKRRKEE